MLKNRIWEKIPAYAASFVITALLTALVYYFIKVPYTLPLIILLNFLNLTLIFFVRIAALRGQVHEKFREPEAAEDLFLESDRHSFDIASTIKDSTYHSSKIIGNINIISEQITNASSALIESSSAIEEITRTISQFVKLSENQAAAVSHTSASIEQMNASIGSISSTAAIKQNKSAELKRMAIEGEEQQISMNRIIQNILFKVGSIQDVIKLINNLSSETNTLALNAAIESSHAGERGKGFSIISAEVRKLSKSTAENAKLVKSDLGRIVEGIHEISSMSEKGMGFYKEIREEVSNIAAALEEIVTATKELKKASGEIVSAISSIVQLSETIKTGSHEIAASAGDISKSIGDIESASTKSADRMRDISSTAGDINEIFRVLTEKKIAEEKALGNVRMKLPSERASFINIPVIILQHILWVIKIRSVIDGRLTLDVNEIGDHTKCDLGKWILGETSIPFREEPFFADLVSEHEILHSFVKEIVAEKNSLSISVLEKKFHELYGKSEKIVEYLTLIYNKNVSKILIAA